MFRSRLVRIGAATLVGAMGLIAYEAVTQVAGAQAPPVVNTDYAAYPPAGVLPATCGDERAGLRHQRRPGAGAGAERAIQLPVLLQLRGRFLRGGGRWLRVVDRRASAQRRVRVPTRHGDRRPAPDGRPPWLVLRHDQP